MADKTIASSYANPFAALQWQPMLTYSAGASRVFMLGGAAVTLASSLQTILDPAPGLVLDLPAGLPTSIAVGGVPLTADGMTPTLDAAKSIDVDIIADQPANTWYQAALIEITVVGTMVMRTPVIAVSGPAPHLALPPKVMVPGHTYTLVAACIAGGFRNAAAGDLQTFTLPVSIGQASSGVFTVVAP